MTTRSLHGSAHFHSQYSCAETSTQRRTSLSSTYCRVIPKSSPASDRAAETLVTIDVASRSRRPCSEFNTLLRIFNYWIGFNSADRNYRQAEPPPPPLPPPRTLIERSAASAPPPPPPPPHSVIDTLNDERWPETKTFCPTIFRSGRSDTQADRSAGSSAEGPLVHTEDYSAQQTAASASGVGGGQVD